MRICRGNASEVFKSHLDVSTPGCSPLRQIYLFNAAADFTHSSKISFTPYPRKINSAKQKLVVFRAQVKNFMRRNGVSHHLWTHWSLFARQVFPSSWDLHSHDTQFTLYLTFFTAPTRQLADDQFWYDNYGHSTNMDKVCPTDFPFRSLPQYNGEKFTSAADQTDLWTRVFL